MTADSIAADLTACRDRIEATEDCSLIAVTRLPTAEGIELATDSLAEAAALAEDLGAGACYLQVDRNRADDVLRAVVAFFHEGVLHTATRTPDRTPTTTGGTAADPDAIDDEERLARIVFRDGRFNDTYTAEDTALLLNALDVDYDPDAVSLEAVHRRAMELPDDE